MSSWNNDYMKNVRKQMLNNEMPPSCMKCYKEEDAGHMSKRFWETEYWSRRVDMEEIIARRQKMVLSLQRLDILICV